MRFTRHGGRWRLGLGWSLLTIGTLGLCLVCQGQNWLWERRMSADLAVREWQALTNSERVTRCRELAVKAESAAQSVRPELQQAYEAIAEKWLALAAEVEQWR
jgi:hypothetical protein